MLKLETLNGPILKFCKTNNFKKQSYFRGNGTNHCEFHTHIKKQRTQSFHYNITFVDISSEFDHYLLLNNIKYLKCF